MTPDDYRAAINRAQAAAGRDDSGWNRRFRDALASERLRLAASGDPRARSPSYPGGVAYEAPLPIRGDSGWLPGALIIADDRLPSDEEVALEARQERERERRDPRDRYGL